MAEKKRNSFVEHLLQTIIVITGCTCIWMISRPEDWSKWGYVIGIFGQPVWMYTAWKDRRWGIIVMTIWYTYAIGQGIWFGFFAAGGG